MKVLVLAVTMERILQRGDMLRCSIVESNLVLTMQHHLIVCRKYSLGTKRAELSSKSGMDDENVYLCEKREEIVEQERAIVILFLEKKAF